jgi:uncharacterized protein (TIGR01777 family)
MSEILFILVILQGLMGAFDTLYHHELKAMLPWSSKASTELIIHGIRNLFYAFIFASLALGEWHGVYAILFGGILVIEVLLTLWDFVIEDQTRALPSTERVTHTLLAINYGVILAYLIPLLFSWSKNESGFIFALHPIYSYILLVFSIAVFIWAFRDGLSGLRLQAVNKLKQIATQKTMAISAQREQMNIKTYLVTGGSGFIGRRLCQQLINQGHQVIVVTRNFSATADLFHGQVTLLESIQQLQPETHVDIIINLAGEPLAASRWNEQSKAKFIDSRVSMTKSIEAFIERADVKPSVLINGSAIGFYGLRKDEKLTESDLGQQCYSHRLCKAWEEAALKIEQQGTRVCLLRTGIVLGMGGGPLSSLLFPFQFGLGGRIGDGKQWMSWIHIDDLIRMVFFAIADKNISGPINGVSPNPATNAVFSKTLGKVLNRPVIFPIPPFVLRLLVGEMAEELLINGQRVVPDKAVSSGFEFDYPELKSALNNLIKSS